MKLKIAVVQFKTHPSSLQENLKKAETFVKKAATKEASLIVFPEYFLDEGALKTADSKGYYRKHFQKLAKTYQIDIVPGSFLEKEKGKLYNTTYYINSEGKIVAKYQKKNLWKEEKNNLTPGKENAIFETQFGKMSLIICWDLISSKIFRKMLKEKVEIVICPSYWLFGDAGEGVKYNPNSEVILVDSLCTERAFENEMIVVFCNIAGKEGLKTLKDQSIGHSQIAEPFKGAIKKLDHNKEEMFIQEIDTNLLKVAEQAYEIKKDMKRRSKVLT